MSDDDRDAAYRRLRDHYAARTGRTPEHVERAFSGDRAERLLAGRATPDELLAETDECGATLRPDMITTACPSCEGTGRVDIDGAIACAIAWLECGPCDGTGQINRPDQPTPDTALTRRGDG